MLKHDVLTAKTTLEENEIFFAMQITVNERCSPSRTPAFLMLITELERIEVLNMMNICRNW